MCNDDLLVRLEIKKTKYQTSFIMSEKKKLAILNVQTFLVQIRDFENLEHKE